MKLVLIRHAEAQGNPEQRMLGRSNPDLTPRGCQQAQALHTYFATHNYSPSQIFTSPLQRAQATANLICPPPHPPTLEILTDLTEIDGGIFTGLTWAEAKHHYPDLTQQLEAQLEWLPIPQAESPKQAYERAKRVWSKVLETSRNQDQVWVVSHAGFLQYLLAVIMGIDKVWQIKIPPSAWFELELLRPDLVCSSKPDHCFNSVFWQIQQFNTLCHWNSDPPECS